ncbi:hypothetical protein JAAARDRAFT_136560, partial [Jaapia argillacea MUCL 33604]
MVDAWAVTDQAKLRWFRNNQTKIMADVYQGLVDAVARDANLNDIGKRTILPSSYIAGTRCMRGWYQDSMAIVRTVSNADFFLTMTTNTNWKEIQDELLPGQTASDRPDIVARVFKLKAKALLEDIRTNGILGKVVAHIHTIEFQKQGLPHMHLIIFL